MGAGNRKMENYVTVELNLKSFPDCVIVIVAVVLPGGSISERRWRREHFLHM